MVNYTIDLGSLFVLETLWNTEMKVSVQNYCRLLGELLQGHNFACGFVSLFCSNCELTSGQETVFSTCTFSSFKDLVFNLFFKTRFKDLKEESENCIQTFSIVTEGSAIPDPIILIKINRQQKTTFSFSSWQWIFCI